MTRKRYHNHYLHNVDSRVYHENRQLSLEQDQLSDKIFRAGASVKIMSRAVANDDGQGTVNVAQRDLLNWQSRSEPLETSSVPLKINEMSVENYEF
ncbi:hypothetical protein EC973_007230, partial [Apophysomyces ossiformis]